MARESQLITLKKGYRGHVPKSLNIGKSWYTMRPFIVEHFGHEGYEAIPHYIDTKAYQIGHIFVQEASDIQCFCGEPQLKILGPIRDFLAHGKSNSRWSNTELPLIKTTGDDTNFQVVLENGKNTMRFRALDCYFLDKAPDMKLKNEVAIDRSSHEDLTTAEWFGLITGAVIANESDIFVKRNHRERVFHVGERPHTILFKYEICKMDKEGRVYDTSTTGMEWKWLPVQERDMNSLPLTEFVSQSTKIKS